MLLLICFLITLCNYSYYAVTSATVENAYIDTLVQRYLTEEKSLWDLIYSNRSSRSDRDVNSIMNKIDTLHLDYLNDGYLDYVMSSEIYTETFKKYVNFSHVRDSAEVNEQLILTKSVSDTYLTWKMTFGVYDYPREDTLFKMVVDVSLS